MTVTELIDQVIAYSDNVSPSGADVADRRQRILSWLIEEATQTYYAREWVWRVTPTVPSPGTPTHPVIPANQGWGLLPSDFLSIGKLGAVYNLSQAGSPLEPAAESEVADMIAMNTLISSSRVFAIFGNDGASPTPRKKIWLPQCGTDITLQLFYSPKAPTLDEASNNDKLAVACPEEYHMTVILPGVRYRARRSKGDTRWTDDRDDRLQGLNEMIRNNRRMQGGEQRLPSFFGY